MELLTFDAQYSQTVIQLFNRVFTASEGEAEGQAVSQFVDRLIHTTPSQDLYGFIACADSDGSNKQIQGCIFFSRMVLSNGHKAFILSPVAISSNSQGLGIGQQLIRHGLAELQASGVEYVFTYGDPNYYSRFGFAPISESQVKAPFTLSQPQGWLALAFEGFSLDELSGSCQCVEALNVPDLW